VEAAKVAFGAGNVLSVGVGENIKDGSGLLLDVVLKRNGPFSAVDMMHMMIKCVHSPEKMRQLAKEIQTAPAPVHPETVAIAAGTLDCLDCNK
jgi:hypothetical protein